jgi:hypothetical protein
VAVRRTRSFDPSGPTEPTGWLELLAQHPDREGETMKHKAVARFVVGLGIAILAVGLGVTAGLLTRRQITPEEVTVESEVEVESETDVETFQPQPV